MAMLWSIISKTTHYNIVPNDLISLFIWYGQTELTMDAIPATIMNAAWLRELDYRKLDMKKWI